jgi:hypothetical protein
MSSFQILEFKPLGRFWYVGQESLATPIEQFLPTAVLALVKKVGVLDQKGIGGRSALDSVKLSSQEGQMHVVHRNLLPTLPLEA